MPVDNAVLAHDESLEIWISLERVTHDETEIKTGTLPANVADFVTVDLLSHLNTIGASCHRDRRIWVHVINVLHGNVTM